MNACWASRRTWVWISQHHVKKPGVAVGIVGGNRVQRQEGRSVWPKNGQFQSVRDLDSRELRDKSPLEQGTQVLWFPHGCTEVKTPAYTCIHTHTPKRAGRFYQLLQ